MIKYTIDNFDENHLNKAVIRKLIDRHIADAERIQKLERYYDGEHSIFERSRPQNAPNNRVAVNHAKHITDIAVGYFMSNPITYASTTGEDLDSLLTAFDRAGVDVCDSDNAFELSITGEAYEYVYVGEGTSDIRVKNLSSSNTFMLYDTSIEERELAGVYYRVIRDDGDDRIRYSALVATEHYIYEFSIYDNDGGYVTDEPREHFFGAVPIIYYQNNHDSIGDFEQEISQIDAYDTVTSDRVNNFQENVDALLIVFGTLLSDDSTADEAKQALKDGKLLEFPDKQTMGAEWLTHPLDQSGIESLQVSIGKDILKMANIPDFSDEAFAGNASGVAIAFKCLMLEWMTRTKERYYKIGLQKRIKLFSNFLGLKQIFINAMSVIPHFTRALPMNNLETAQIVSMLSDRVSTRTLLQQLPFVEDPDAELAAVRAEQKEEAELQRQIFDIRPNTPPDDDLGGDV